MQSVLSELVEGIGRVTDVRSVGGGCISEASRVSVGDDRGRQRVLFVKRNDASFLENFRCEWDGLLQLAGPDAIGVPAPIAVGVAEGASWLVTEWIEPGSQGSGFFSRFGQELAELHRQTLGDRIGLDRDNYLGAAPQPNQPCESWPDFFAQRRIGFQIGWAVDQGLASGTLRRDCERIVESMDSLLRGRAEQTSLLHGDLWSGNYLCADDGRPVIIDPAVYYGCREAELGMLRLFGSCPSQFYDAYHDTFPLPTGWQRRTSVYVLYHLLNHLNLFGSGYLGQCQSTAAEILRS